MANGPRPLPTAKADRLCLFMHIKMATINANKRTTITNINMEIHTHTHTHTQLKGRQKAAVKNVANVSKIKIYNKDTITLTDRLFASVFVSCVCVSVFVKPKLLT